MDLHYNEHCCYDLEGFGIWEGVVGEILLEITR